MSKPKVTGARKNSLSLYEEETLRGSHVIPCFSRQFVWGHPEQQQMVSK